MKHNIFLAATCALLMTISPSCTELASPSPEQQQTEQPQQPQHPGESGEPGEPGETENPSEKPDQPSTPDQPEPEQPDPQNPEPDQPEPDQPEPDQPEPEQPDQPEPKPEQPGQPDPDQPTTPDNDGPEPGKSTMVAYDFTGQYCIYCPETTRGLLETQKKFGENYIVVALHSSSSYSPSLYQPEAVAYHQNMIDEGTLQAGYPNNIYNSLGCYMEMLSPTAYINSPSLLELQTKIRQNGKELSISLKSEICRGQSERLEGRAFIILLWLTENNVLSLQSDNHVSGGWDFEYNNMHLFRRSLNGLWGEAYIPGEAYNYQATIPDFVVAANSQLVVLILDKTTKETVAAAEYPLAQ